MPTSSNFQTFRDPAFSLWQSAIHSTLLKRQAKARAMGVESNYSQTEAGLGATADNPFMIASAQAMRRIQSGPAATPETSLQAKSIVGTIAECAKLAAEIAWDLVFDPGKVSALKSELADSTCDPFWLECITEYEVFVASGQKQPYTVYGDINDYVLTNCIPDNAKIAIIADWGTGMSDALVLLQQIAKNFQPDALIHLGDIYYSGTVSECAGNFTKLIDEAWPENPPLVFTLDGNHDRYAGAGGGYFPLIASLNANVGLPQPNSYFAIRNNFWQFLSMDTGYHDTDPFTVSSNLTYLEQTEIDWHLDKIRNNGKDVDPAINSAAARGTVLLSHHQLMSFTGVGHDSDGNPLAVNPKLAEAFAPVFNLVDFWLWGHEHDLCIFESYSMGPGQMLPAGRCVGAGAIPVFLPRAKSPANLVIPASESGPPAVVAGTNLGNNRNVFNHCYAIMTLTGPALAIDYYQFDSTDAKPGKPPAPTAVPFRDSVAGPLAAAKASVTGA